MPRIHQWFLSIDKKTRSLETLGRIGIVYQFSRVVAVQDRLMRFTGAGTPVQNLELDCSPVVLGGHIIVGWFSRVFGGFSN